MRPSTRRLVALLVVVAAIAAACGDDDDPTVAPGTATASTVAGSGDGPAAPTATTPDGDAVIPPAPATSLVEPEPPDDGSDAAGPPGSYAPAYLRPGRGDRIVLEVASNPGAEPSGETVDHVTSVLGAASGKDVVPSGGAPPPTRDEWTAADVRAAIDMASHVPQGQDAAVLRLLFLHGRWAEDENVLGVAVRADAAAIFVDGMREAATPIVGAGAIEVATTTHEVGHLLGLVDLFLDTGRADPEHPGHSSNERSVMYWAVESSLVTDLLVGGPPRDFDDADRADLAAIRSGE